MLIMLVKIQTNMKAILEIWNKYISVSWYANLVKKSVYTYFFLKSNEKPIIPIIHFLHCTK